MLKIFRYLELKEWVMFGLILVFIIIQTNVDLMIPGYMSQLSAFLQSSEHNISDIISVGKMMVLCSIISMLFSIAIVVLNARIDSNYTAALRRTVFYKVQDFSLENENRFSCASLITRTTNDVSQIQIIIGMGIQMLFKAPILAVGALMRIIGKNWQWSVATGISMAALSAVLMMCFLLTAPKNKRLQSLIDSINNITKENIAGIQIVRAFNAEEYQEEKFQKINNELAKTSIFVNTIMSFLTPLMNLIMNVFSVSIYWIGAALINKTAILDRVGLFSDMVAYLSYAMQLASAFMMMVILFVYLPRTFVSSKRIMEVLDAPITINDGRFERSKAGEGGIEFENVYFKYPGSEDYALKNISFSAERGQTVAIIGSTGCGKTTLVKMIMRLFEVSSGKIMIDQMNVNDYTLKALRDKISYVPQKSTFFSGTIASNVAFNDEYNAPINEEKIISALKTAQAYEFVEMQDDKLNEKILSGGSNFSGGQRQRLAIARAVYKNAEIMILDNSFSALDNKTDLMVRTSLKESCSDSIKIIVAQRISTIIDADKILVLDNGELVGCGSHAALLNECEVYRQIVASQLSKEIN